MLEGFTFHGYEQVSSIRAYITNEEDEMQLRRQAGGFSFVRWPIIDWTGKVRVRVAASVRCEYPIEPEEEEEEGSAVTRLPHTSCIQPCALNTGSYGGCFGSRLRSLL